MKLKIIKEWRETITNVTMLAIVDDEGEILMSEDIESNYVEDIDSGTISSRDVGEDEHYDTIIDILYRRVLNKQNYTISEESSIEGAELIVDDLGVSLYGDSAYFVPRKNNS